MVVKTYRGLLADGAQEKIPLSTKDGSVGYRIVKLEIITEKPGHASVESVVQIFKKEQSSVPTSAATINFTDADLLGVAIYIAPSSIAAHMSTTIFDNEVFNQDIFVTHTENNDANACNYYIELEQLKLDHTQNMSATLKAIRGSAED